MKVTLQYMDKNFEFDSVKIEAMDINGQKITFFRGKEVNGKRTIDFRITKQWELAK